MIKMPNIILASSSIYRLNLLKQIHIEPIVIKPNIDETPLANETPQDLAFRLAYQKAKIIHNTHFDSIIIGCDQVLYLDDKILGKPLTHDNAVLQLKHMRNKTCIFYTSICMLHKDLIFQDFIQTQVVMHNYSDELIQTYLNIEKPYDCSGSAKSEGLGAMLIKKMHSDDPSALIGLPLTKVIDGLIKFNYSFFNLSNAFLK